MVEAENAAGMGSMLERLPIIVAAVEDTCLMGIDFLTHVMLSMRGVNSRVECLTRNHDPDMAKMMTASLRTARAASDIKEPAVVHTSNIDMPRRNRREPGWDKNYPTGGSWISSVSALHVAHAGKVLHVLSLASHALPHVDKETGGPQ
ncbi:hypothetical protein E2C01_044736 [Portunus trituberculatus]|uniref:Uncharacterized protein n=1 Tax=Portunus trituberculatus TaxID=210409 RepID=A0A5B7FWD5_PORTR|nr:hypothetical protein [Portunus trituberculatus]